MDRRKLPVNANSSPAEHVVRKVHRIDEELFVLELEREGLGFVPGDCVALCAGEGVSRPYSIASGNKEDALRFLIRKMEGGIVSPWLMNRKAGDKVGLSPPFGWFRPGQDIDGAPAVFIATGTGIAPFLSYRQTFGETPPQQILFGVRKQIHAFGFESLSNWCTVQLAVSREKVPGHQHGRVTDLLDNGEVNPAAHYYLCGLEGMINEVSTLLQARGVDLFNIHREVFFHG